MRVVVPKQYYIEWRNSLRNLNSHFLSMFFGVVSETVAEELPIRS